MNGLLNVALTVTEESYGAATNKEYPRIPLSMNRDCRVDIAFTDAQRIEFNCVLARKSDLTNLKTFRLVLLVLTLCQFESYCLPHATVNLVERFIGMMMETGIYHQIKSLLARTLSVAMSSQ